MTRIYPVRVNNKGAITLPKELRENNHIQAEDILTLTEFGEGVVMMSCPVFGVDVVAGQLAQEWQTWGESL